MRANRRDVTRVPLQDWLGNVLFKISHAEGNAKVTMKMASPIRDYRYGRNEIVAYRLTEQVRASNSEESMPVITVGEMKANVCRSRTARLPEWDTKGRDSKYARELARDPDEPPEDFVELAQQKVKMWQKVPLWNPRRVAWASRAAHA